MKSERRRKQLDKKRTARKARFTTSGTSQSKYATKSQMLKRLNHRNKKALGRNSSRIWGFDFAMKDKPWR